MGLPRRGGRGDFTGSSSSVPHPMHFATPADVVSPDDLLGQIRQRYPSLVQATTWGARTLRFAPDAAPGVDFVTVEERDHAPHGRAGLDATGAYRLGFGVSAERYAALFGTQTSWTTGTPVPDAIMPHPVHAAWAAVVNPSPATLARLWPLLDESYALAVRRHATRARGAGDAVH